MTADTAAAPEIQTSDNGEIDVSQLGDTLVAMREDADAMMTHGNYADAHEMLSEIQTTLNDCGFAVNDDASCRLAGIESYAAFKNMMENMGMEPPQTAQGEQGQEQQGCGQTEQGFDRAHRSTLPAEW